MHEHDLKFPGWRVVAACAVGVFFATVPLTTFAVFLKPLTDEFGWSREQISYGYGALTLTAAVSAPLIGLLLDRVGARRVIVSGLAISAAAWMSLATLRGSLRQWQVTFAVLGIAMMASSPIAHSRVVFSWFDARRGRALALMLCGAALSAIVSPLLAQALIRAWGWKSAWLVLGLTTAIVACPIAAGAIHERAVPQASGQATRQTEVFEALRSRLFWTLVVVMLFGTAATNAATVHLIALLTDRGVPATFAAITTSTMGAASLVGRLTTGWLLDRFAAPRVSALLLTIAAAGASMLAIAPSLGLGLLAAACIGFGSGGEVDVTPYLLSRYFGLRSLSTLYGLSWTAWGVAGAIGPALMGRTFDSTGSYAIALAILAGITMAAALLMLTLPSPAPSHVYDVAH